MSTAAPSRRAFYALLLLSLINLVNYLDRYVISAVLPTSCGTSR
jgi:hypothetical protein